MNWPPFLLIFALYTLNPITISVYPRFSMPPATFRITVLVPRHADNRRVCLGYRVVGEHDPLRNSCQDMDGVTAVRTRTVYWDIRASGDYEAIAVLTRIVEGQKQSYRSAQPFKVLGME